jgi:uncharacterized protein
MKKITESSNQLLWFLVVVLTLTYGFGGAALWMGGMESFPVARYSMLIPGLVVLGVYIFGKHNPFKQGELGLRFGKWKYLLVAPLAVCVLVLVTYGLSYLLKPELFLSWDQIVVNVTKSSVGGGHPIVAIVLIFGLNVLVAPLLNFPMFLGEELGWRGFLGPKLLLLMPPMLALVFSGMIWSVWHLFGLLMGLNYPDQPQIGLVMMTLLCIPTGTIFQYYFYKSGSVFVPMMAHGSLNWTSNTVMMFFVDQTAFDTIMYGPTGVVGIAVFWIVGIVCYFKLDWRMANNVLHRETNKSNI